MILLESSKDESTYSLIYQKEKKLLVKKEEDE